MTHPPKENFFILDGTSLIYRSFFAIQNLKNTSGLPTNAIFGFTKALQKFLREKKPHHFTIVLDAKGPTFRHVEYEAYKAQRKPMPDELVAQLPWIKEIIQAYGLPLFEVTGFEADDVIGSLAQKAKEKFHVLIISPDKDLLQLVEPQVQVMPSLSEDTILDEEAVRKNYGIAPNQICDFLALMGDSSDNIPGVPGIGPKTASLLLSEFQNLEELLEKSWTQKGKIKKDFLIKNQEVALLSKTLATLRLNVPVELPASVIPKPNQSKLVEIFQKLEFRDLLKDVLPSPPVSLDWQEIKDEEKTQALHKTFLKKGEISFSLCLEKSAHPCVQIAGIAIALSEKEIFYFPFAGSTQAISEILKDEKIKKIGYDLKISKLGLEANGFYLEGLSFDAMIAAFLVNPSLHLRTLKDLAAQFLSSDLQGTLNPSSEDACHEALTIYKLKPILERLLIESEQKDLFEKIEMPLIKVLASMEKEGIPLHIPHLQTMSKELDQLLQALEKKIHQLADGSFNINSPKELSKILFEKLKLPTLKKTKTGYSTNAEVLENLKDQHEIIPSLLEYRQITKLKSTYVDKLPDLVHPDTGRLHTTFSQTIAETGRLSSANPNLQNIPIRSALGKKIREAFVAPQEHLLLSADYSQIELRILAHFSQDPGLVQAFKKDEDIHRSTAQSIFNIPLQEVTEAQRSRAKAINFGIIYGMGTYGLSKELGISFTEAENFIHQYYERFSQVKGFIQKTLEKARETGFVTTLFNRRRYLPDLKSPYPQMRQMAERMAMNTPIQGTAADVIKCAMIQIHKDIKEAGLQTRLVLQIHDELILIVPNEELAKTQSLVKNRMETIVSLKVQLKVDMHSGKNWMEL